MTTTAPLKSEAPETTTVRRVSRGSNLAQQLHNDVAAARSSSACIEVHCPLCSRLCARIWDTSFPLQEFVCSRTKPDCGITFQAAADNGKVVVIYQTATHPAGGAGQGGHDGNR